jgi:demethylmenaquinone methyltransferase/2-methoxy-6-polyprenyl-1,4-benzoquinol methylase
MTELKQGNKPDGKRENAEMFDQIAGSYDFLNHLLSLNIDRGWRRKAIRYLGAGHPKRILDVATGTADMAIGAMNIRPDSVVGIDASPGMLEVGRRKLSQKGLGGVITLMQASAEDLPFADASFDAAMVAFGVRNFTDPAKGLGEICRVLVPGGRLAILEFSLPRRQWILSLYRFYFHRLVPAIGKWFSKDLSAYRYLPDSVEAFPKGDAFVEMLERSGFTYSAYKPLSFGICGLYTATKK